MSQGLGAGTPGRSAAIAPDLSVALVVGRRRGPAAEAVRSILAQPNADRIELLLVDCAGTGADPLEGSDHPSARVLRLPLGTTFGEARASAVRQARADIIAFLEEHCITLPGWSEALVRAHSGPWAGVGGEVFSANPGAGLSDAVYLLGYGAWIPPAERGPVAHLVSHNSSYRRNLLLEAGEALPRLLTSEPLLQDWLTERGHRLLVEPEVRFLHVNETKFGSLIGFYWWNRVFGATRADRSGWSTTRRLGYAVLSPGLIVSRLLRQARTVLRRHPNRWRAFLWNSPLILLINAVAVWGNVLGALRGEADAEARFTDHELNDPDTR